MGNPCIARKPSTIVPELASDCNQSVIQPKPCRCRHNLLQSWGLWWACRFETIHQKSCFKLSDCNLPRIGPLIMQTIPDPSTIDPKMTSINTIKLDRNWIAKLQRIARRLIGLHQYPGNFTIRQPIDEFEWESRRLRKTVQSNSSQSMRNPTAIRAEEKGEGYKELERDCKVQATQ